MTSPATSLFQRYLRRGNPVLMGHLYDRVAPELLTLALHLTKRPSLAEDLVQEVFLQAMQEGAQWEPDISVESWMSHMLALNFQLSCEVQQTSTSITELVDGEQIQDVHNPVTEAQQSELQEKLDSALDSLPEHYRMVIRLLVIEGMNSEEVGEALQRPSGTVRSQLARGLDRLRQILPTAMGLTVWGITHGHGSATPLDAMRDRMLEKAPAPQPTVPPTQWPLAAKLTGVGALVLGAAYFGYDQLAQSPDSAEVMNLEDPVVMAQEEPLLNPIASEGFNQRQAADSDTLPVTVASVSGRVVNAEDVPIPGATVALYYWEPWCEEGHQERLESAHGFGVETVTDSMGRYSLEVPCMPPGAPTLEIDAGDSYTKKSIRFESKMSHLGPFRSGANEMPALRLTPAGTITGVLLHEDGTPAWPASLHIHPGQDPRYTNLYSVQQDGSFRLDQIPVGVHNLRLAVDGVVRQTTVHVHQGQINAIPDVTFPTLTPLRMRVVDADGAQVPRVIVHFRALDESQKDFYIRYNPGTLGYVDTHIPTLDQHEVVVTAEGFASDSEAYRIEPGQSELTVTMAPTSMVRIRATHKGTGGSVGRFILHREVLQDGFWATVGKANYTSPNEDGTKTIDHIEGGRIVVTRTGLQDVFIPCDGPIDHIVEIEMVPLPHIQGRILSAGSPAPGVRVEVCPLEIKRPVGTNPDELRAQLTLHPDKCLTYEAIRWVETDADGQFSLEANSQQHLWYRVRANAGSQSAAEYWFRLEESLTEVHQLPDMELAPTGSLRGQIQVPRGIHPANLVFLLDLDSGSQIAVSDADGKFQIDGIAPGKHYLHLQRRPGMAPLTESFAFTIEGGQILEQEFDLRGLGLSQRHVHLTEQGSPLARHKVYLRTGLPTDADDWDDHLLGITDGLGNVVGELPAKGTASVWIQSPGGEVPRRHATALVPLTCEGIATVDVNF